MKKKFVCLVLSVVLTLSLVACGEAAPADNQQTSAPAEEMADSNEEADEPEAAESENDVNDNAEAEAEADATDDMPVLNAPVTIYEEGDVTITVNPIENRRFSLTVANNSASGICLKYDFIAVNGYQINDSAATNVDAGATRDCEITLDDFFDALGSDDVSSVELKAKLFDYATNTEMSDLGDIILKGEAYGNDSADLVTDEAMLVYSDDKVMAYIDPNLTTTEGDFSLRAFTVNNSEAPLWCSAENFSFNGTPHDGLGDFETAANLRKFDRIIDQYCYSWIGLEKADDIKTIDFDYTVGESVVHVALSNNAGTLSVESASPAN